MIHGLVLHQLRNFCQYNTFLKRGKKSETGFISHETFLITSTIIVLELYEQTDKHTILYLQIKKT